MFYKEDVFHSTLLFYKDCFSIYYNKTYADEGMQGKLCPIFIMSRRNVAYAPGLGS